MVKLDVKKAKISDKIREWAEDYHTGDFVLKGDNPLVKDSLWTRLQRISATEGKGVIVRKPGKSGKEKDSLFLLGILSDFEFDSLKENGTFFKKATVAYISRVGDELFKEEDFLDKNKPEEFVVFGNNDKWEPELQLNETQYDYLDEIYKTTIADMKRSLPRFAIKSRDGLKKNVKDAIRKEWESYSPVVFFSRDDKRPWEPHDTDQWNPASRISEYKAMWDLQYSLFRRLNNIKHNTSKKEERQNNPEIELNEDQFENPENIRLQERISFLREFYEKFGGYEYILEVDGKEVLLIGDKFKEENIKLSTKQQTSENQQTTTNKTEKEESFEERLMKIIGTASIPKKNKD